MANKSGFCILVLSESLISDDRMKFALSWLQEYIAPQMTVAEIGNILTSIGLELDGIEQIGSGFSGVVVGRVLHTEKHPNADRLCVATVSDGHESHQVVCGAPNCRPGIKVAFAKVGASLKDAQGTFVIKKSKLRGVESNGMLCSAKELHLGDDADGIIELPQNIQEGTDLASLYADTLIEISLTPNLGHCASLIGIARELSAAIAKPMHLPQVHAKEESSQNISHLARVNVVDREGCPRYACRIVQHVKIAPSPDWIQKRLQTAGIRPINNVVDCVNYVVLEMGHPLHAFDYDKIYGQEIRVRAAQEKEVFTTLDDKERILTAGDLLICDAQRPIALAGIMGGLNSEVSETTQNILLEAAYFHPGRIRKTSKRLGLATDASRRFERGTDPNLVLNALDRAASLIGEIAGGKVVTGVLDIKANDFPEKTLTCRLSRINGLLGTQLSLNEVEEIFHRLHFHYRSDGQELLTVTVPTYRVDISQEVDLIEEVARIYGYSSIPRQPSYYKASTLPHTPMFLFERAVRTRLIAEQLQDFITCDLIGPSAISVVGEESVPSEIRVSVLNPTSIEQSILRTSLLPGLLQVVKHNIAHQVKEIRGFEVGRIHFKEAENFMEQYMVGIIMTGHSTPHFWGEKPVEVDFFQLKGIIENLLEELNIENVSFQASHFPTFHSGRQASVYVGQVEVGSVGEVHPSIQRRLDVPQRIFFAELNLHELLRLRKQEQKMKPLSLYPSSERDWTITIRDDVSVKELLKQIDATCSKLLEEVQVLDLYQNEKLGKDVKNVTLRLVYRDKTKTVEQEIVEAEHQRIISHVLHKGE